MRKKLVSGCLGVAVVSFGLACSICVIAKKRGVC